MLLVVWDYIKEKWLIAYFRLPTADLSRCSVFRLVCLEVLQNCGLLGFGTVPISVEKSKCLQIGKKEKLSGEQAVHLRVRSLTGAFGLEMLP